MLACTSLLKGCQIIVNCDIINELSKMYLVSSDIHVLFWVVCFAKEFNNSLIPHQNLHDVQNVWHNWENADDGEDEE
jgi:hypothetical protein